MAISWKQWRYPAQAAGSALFAAACALAAGCVSTVKPDPSRPIEYTFRVAASRPWQDSGIRAKTGQIVHCVPEGRWGDAVGMYGPEGDSSRMKDSFMVRAPAFALIMKISGSTNLAHRVLCETNIVAERTGTLLFRPNTALTEGARGTMTVRIMVANDSDSDGLSDYEEIVIWKTDPLNQDTDGNGFTDLEDARRRGRREPR